MYLYKLIDQYDQRTGKKLNPKMEVCGAICDFTGKEAEYLEELGVVYKLNYNSIDPCGGCGVGENEFAKKWKVDLYSFLFQPFVFDDKEELMFEIMDTAKKEGFDRGYFDQLFRWCRIRTADRLLTEGKYTLEELGIERADWMDDDNEDDED